MAIILSDKLIDALAEAIGMHDTRTLVRRIVIDLEAGSMPIVHVERFGDTRLLEVFRHLEGVEVRLTAAEALEASKEAMKAASAVPSD